MGGVAVRASYSYSYNYSYSYSYNYSYNYSARAAGLRRVAFPARERAGPLTGPAPKP